jgi:hypothetical protein
MCQFFSCLVNKNGDVLWDRDLSSHEDLVELFGLRDNNKFRPGFARVEFTPPTDHKLVANVKKWVLKVDESVKPDWFDDVVVREKLEELVSNFIVKKNRKLLVGGPWILVGKTKIDKAVNARIIAMCDSSQVGYMHNSSQVGYMYGSSQVGNMCGSSRIVTNKSTKNVVNGIGK